MRDKLYVYGNWSAYDELSDSIPLTEELAMRQLSELLRLRRAGVRFDAYLMDAFWYAKDGGYRTWRSDAWPDGPDRWLAACQDNGLLPGLWFTVNTLMELDPVPAWRDSVDEKGWGMSLVSGGFLQDFMEVLSYWYRRGVRLFKFDFAEFGAVPARSEAENPLPGPPPRGEGESAREGEGDSLKGEDIGSSAGEGVKGRNIAAFREALGEFRQEHPEAVLMAFNGFERRECMNRSDNPPGDFAYPTFEEREGMNGSDKPRGYYIDPAWLDVFDSIYCGDPRPSDLPAGSFWRSVDIYSDAMTRLFESSGIQLRQIDNCGFMAGDTGTCYWRKKVGWKAMLLLSLARGGAIHVAYGDLGLFDEEDAAWWAEAQRLFGEPSYSFGGWPGDGEAYGWYCGDVIVAVNPSLVRQSLELWRGNWRILCADHGALAFMDGRSASLAGGQVALLGKPSVRWEQSAYLDSSVDAAEPVFVADPAADVRQFDTQWGAIRLVSEEPYFVDLDPTWGRIRVAVRQVDREGRAVRLWPSDDVPSVPIEVTLHSAEGARRLPPMIDRPIWSGVSWWVGDFDTPPGPARLEISARSEAVRVQVLRIV